MRVRIVAIGWTSKVGASLRKPMMTVRQSLSRIFQWFFSSTTRIEWMKSIQNRTNHKFNPAIENCRRLARNHFFCTIYGLPSLIQFIFFFSGFCYSPTPHTHTRDTLFDVHTNTRYLRSFFFSRISCETFLLWILCSSSVLSTLSFFADSKYFHHRALLFMSLSSSFAAAYATNNLNCRRWHRWGWMFFDVLFFLFCDRDKRVFHESHVHVEQSMFFSLPFCDTTKTNDITFPSTKQNWKPNKRTEPKNQKRKRTWNKVSAIYANLLRIIYLRTTVVTLLDVFLWVYSVRRENRPGTKKKESKSVYLPFASCTHAHRLSVYVIRWRTFFSACRFHFDSFRFSLRS